MLTFQQLIYKLTAFWESQGCIIHQGHDLETGAGTFNPATFLRSLGPEPYKTAYIEPSRRPSDGRYGENPNRTQLFHQLQVVIKPSPLDIQKKYLESLEAIGIDLKKHDIRFVHDDWESPTLGAFGLGWEVWMDGMEITQFTYFQAVASIPLKPISVEITYGLERLCMYVQNKDSFFDMQWNEDYTYGDIVKQNEIEWSAYNFTEASTEMWLRHFDDFEKEARTLITKGLPLPAYDFVLKASHAFNLLEARGAISVTERTGYIARIRDLSRLIGNAYLAMREKVGFPLLTKSPPEEEKSYKPKALPKTFDSYRRESFLFEIGSEQLPATFVPIGMRNLENTLRALFKKHELGFEQIQIFGTPRRIGALVHGLIEGTEEKSIERKGPAVQTAFDASGNPTKQGAGFLKAIGLEDFTLKDIEKSNQIEIKDDYLFAHLKKEGKSVYEILHDELPSLILNLDFPKKMRWGNLDITYPRPLHWITALYADHTIPFRVGNIEASHHSFGHAQLSPEKIILKKADDYFTILKEHKVLADVSEREQSILRQLMEIEEKLSLKATEKKKVLSQVLHLTEWPQLTYADFDPDFLKVPQEVLISEMVEHQKYFPLSKNEKLQNLFVITADNTPSDLIRQGNQKVLSARLKDGVFLYEQDLKTSLETFNKKLEKMTFQKELGSMLDKVNRLTKHAQTLNEMLKLADPKKVARAATLCKSDLATDMVGEFPELQGTIGKSYALAQKEDLEVANAIEEHWLPKIEGGNLPQTSTGMILSLADKIDNLLGYFSVDLKPTSSSDPYALRRQTIGIIKILLQNEISLNLAELFDICKNAYPTIKDNTLINEILIYITSRAKGVLEDMGYAKDEVEASFAGLCLDPYDQYCKVKALHQFRQIENFDKLFEVYKRAKGQLGKTKPKTFDPRLAIEPAEKALVTALESMEKNWTNFLATKQYKEAFEEMAKLQVPLANLFDKVKILADEPALRDNRLSLLHKVFSHFEQLLDFSKIQGS